MIAALLAVALAATPLFYFQREGAACRWRVLSVADGRAESVHTTPSCPVLLVWDPGQRRVVYTLGSRLYQRSWRDGGPPVVLARLPFRGPPEAWRSRLVVSAQSGRIRVAELLPVAEEDVVRRDGQTSFRRGGRLHPAGDLALGDPFLAVVWDLDQAGRWKEVAVSPTTWGAGGTLGLAVVSERLASTPGTHPLDEVSPSGQWDPSRLAIDDGRRRAIERAVAAGPDGFGYIEADGRRGIVFPVVVGDTPHVSSPIYCCRDGCAQMTKLLGLPESPGHRETFSVQLSGDHLLVAPEYLAPGRVWVYEACAPRPVRSLTGAEAAHWLPGPPGWLGPQAPHP